MFLGDEDDMPAEWTEPTSPSDLRVAQQMLEVASRLSQELAAQRGSLAIFTNHPGEIGRSHEGYLNRALSRFLPKRWNAGTGFISGTDGISTQQDILIFDQVDHAPLQEQDGTVVISEAAVAGTIEVKTTLDSTTEFSKAISNRLVTPSRFNALFAFGGLTAETALDALWNPIRERHQTAEAEAQTRYPGVRLSVDLPEFVFIRGRFILFLRRSCYDHIQRVPMKLVRIDGTRFTDGHGILGLIAALWKRGIEFHGQRVPGWLEHWGRELDGAGEAINWPHDLDPRRER